MLMRFIDIVFISILILTVPVMAAEKVDTGDYSNAIVTYEDIKTTNKDSIKAYLELRKPCIVNVYLNGYLINEAGLLEAGEHELDLVTDVGENNYEIYVTDPDTGYTRSTEYSLVKDVIAPTIKMARSYENIVTGEDSITFEGSIDPDYNSFAINDTPIKVEVDHTWKYVYGLREGDNNIRIEASDEAGNVSEYNTTIKMIIPEVAKVPWFPIIMGVCLAGLAVTDIVVAVNRRKREEIIDEDFEEDEKPAKKSHARMDVIPVWLQETLRIGLPVLCVYILLAHLVFVTAVMSGSMEPKLKTGNTAVYNRLAYHKSPPERGDIVVFWSDEFNVHLAKRVIGIPGDHIEFKNGYVFINGKMTDESEYIAEDIETNCGRTFDVPQNCIFVLGDNREYSYDSRFWLQPYISYDSVEGKYMGQLQFSLIYMFEQQKNND